MSNLVNSEFVVNAGGGWSYVARIKNHDGADILQADLTTITVTVTDVDSNTITEAATSVTIASTIFDTLQSVAAVWDQSYNFKHDLAITAVPATGKGHLHTVQYTFTPGSGAVFLSREINVIGD